MFPDPEERQVVYSCLQCGHRWSERRPAEHMDPALAFDNGQYRLLPEPVFNYRNPEEKYVGNDKRKRR